MVRAPLRPLAMLFTNSKNCVARTIVYGTADALISFPWAIFARKYPLFEQTLGADDRQRDVMSHAGGHLGGEEVPSDVSKNRSTATSSNDG